MTEIPTGYERIRHHSEECDCEQCGFPMDVGDKVYWLDDTPYCTKTCARAGDDRAVEGWDYA